MPAAKPRRPRRIERQVTIRLSQALWDRLTAICEGALPGLSVPRSEVIRLALERGLDVLEDEQQSRPAKARPRRARAAAEP